MIRLDRFSENLSFNLLRVYEYEIATGLTNRESVFTWPYSSNPSFALDALALLRCLFATRAHHIEIIEICAEHREPQSAWRASEEASPGTRSPATEYSSSAQRERVDLSQLGERADNTGSDHLSTNCRVPRVLFASNSTDARPSAPQDSPMPWIDKPASRPTSPS